MKEKKAKAPGKVKGKKAIAPKKVLKKRIGKSKKSTELAKKLTAKQKKLVEGIVVERKGKQRAAIDAGYSPASAHAVATETLKNPKIDEYRTALLEEQGLSITEGLAGVKRSLHATKVISAMVIASDGEGMKDANSMTRDFVEVPDYPTQLKAAIEVVDMHGFKPDKKIGLDVTVETMEQRLKRLGLA